MSLSLRSTLLACVLSAIAVPALAQNAAPPAPRNNDAELPSINTATLPKLPRPGAAAPAPVAAAPGTAAVAQDDTALGANIIGEADTAVGLYLSPWKKEPATDIDRPPSLFTEPPVAVDGHDFREQVDYYHTVYEYRRPMRSR